MHFSSYDSHTLNYALIEYLVHSIRKWVPALRKMPKKYIYEPWKAPDAIQRSAGVKIGRDYPKPIVDHATESKENMDKMAYAYELHKANGRSGAEEKTSTKKSKAKASTSKGGPARKKVKK